MLCRKTTDGVGSMLTDWIDVHPISILAAYKPWMQREHEPSGDFYSGLECSQSTLDKCNSMEQG